MQIACMLPVILIGRELEGGCTSFHEFAPFRHGLYPCMVSPYFRRIRRLPRHREAFVFLGDKMLP